MIVKLKWCCCLFWFCGSSQVNTYLQGHTGTKWQSTLVGRHHQNSPQNIKGPPKRDWRVCKGTCKENYGEPPKRQTPVRGYWLGPTNVFFEGKWKWWNMMKHDETWWKVMISSCFIMFHHVSSFCIQAQFGWEIFNFHPEGVWLFAFGQPFWLQI